MLNKRLIWIVFFVVLLLLIPFIAMQFTDEVKWGPLDFLAAGVILLTAGFMGELVLRRVANIGYRIALFLVILIVLILIWLELAVGIFKTPFAGS